PCKAHVALDHRERVVGYVLYDDVDTHCRIAEVGGQSRAIFHTLLHDMARRAVRLRRPSLSLSLPPDHPFALFCRDYGCIDHTAYERNAGPMGRLVNLHTCIEKILPELANRWRLLDRKQVLAVRTDLGHFTLSWQGERLHMERDAPRLAARLDQRALTELLLGYKTASSLKTNDQLACNRTQLTLLEHLFPPQQAHMSWPDRF
ncbi:MAG: sterol carrier protein domain-containing protein, partial [Candidatus Latescibacterota bacterium]